MNDHSTNPTATVAITTAADVTDPDAKATPKIDCLRDPASVRGNALLNDLLQRAPGSPRRQAIRTTARRTAKRWR